MLNGNLDEAEYFMAEASKLDIKVLPPHVNDSKLGFTITPDKAAIRAGFNAIKGVGPKAVDSIMANQPFTTVNDYFDRNDKAALNKAVVAALIKAGAFEDMGINIEENDIPVELHDNFKFTELNGDKYVIMNRGQMEKWYEMVNEINAVKSIPNYIVPLEMIPGKFFDIYELVEEKDGSGIVVPETRLNDLGLKLKSLPDQTKTRKKPKGSFDKAADPMANVPPFRKPIITSHREISAINISYLDLYLRESEELGFSFLPHPLEKHMDKINLFADMEDGQEMTTAGIVTSIIQRQTKKGNPFYWVTIKSPRDLVRLTLWDNQFKNYKDYLKKNSLIVVRGTKGFGGMGVEIIKYLGDQIK
jgi:DNA polymerase III alpha subunit